MFSETRIEGTAGETLPVDVNFDIELLEVAFIVKESLPEGSNLEENEGEEEWKLKSETPITRFSLPIKSEKSGLYVLNIENQPSIILDIKDADSDEVAGEENDILEKKNHAIEGLADEELIDKSVIDIYTFEAFQSAVRNNKIEKINVMADLVALNAVVTQLIRSSSLMIYGNGHTVNRRNNEINKNSAVVSGSAGLMEYNNIRFDSEANDATTTNINVRESTSSNNK